MALSFFCNASHDILQLEPSYDVVSEAVAEPTATAQLNNPPFLHNKRHNDAD